MAERVRMRHARCSALTAEMIADISRRIQISKKLAISLGFLKSSSVNGFDLLRCISQRRDLFFVFGRGLNSFVTLHTLLPALRERGRMAAQHTFELLSSRPRELVSLAIVGDTVSSNAVNVPKLKFALAADARLVVTTTKNCMCFVGLSAAFPTLTPDPGLPRDPGSNPYCHTAPPLAQPLSTPTPSPSPLASFPWQPPFAQPLAAPSAGHASSFHGFFSW
eukprot:gnl/Chilomastix_cuspidata/3290.p2 GENE.gnl/Chilomastix_cuspidata/3290~~gnl/Chilomastix_cuspidata/3290.p2  ORF type:complete len:221 (+),score=66.99 gnl/Chilomastix_cuspidata/3290:344-1006(+)